MYFNVIFLCLSLLHRLGSHLSPSGTECYITSDMFYVEVQLDTTGQLVDVKVAHQGENPTVSLTSINQSLQFIFIHAALVKASLIGVLYNFFILFVGYRVVLS